MAGQSGTWCLDLGNRSLTVYKSTANHRHLFDELGNALFSISEPRWSSDEDSKRIKALKRRLYDIYVNYRGVYERAK